MITIACTNCKTTLTMDEAFAGGVCRCQHCGTIQTVPSHLKQGSTAGAAAGQGGQAVGTSKSLYQQTRASTDAASGLEALGDVVTSSGLGSGRLKSPRVTPPTGASIDRTAGGPKARNPLLIPLLIAVAVVVVLIIGLVIFLATRPSATSGTGDNSNSGTDNNSSPETPVASLAGPSFLGTAIKGSNVVYLIDRGNATQDFFDGLKAGLVKSLHSLGQDRAFKVILWDNGDPAVSIPASGIPIDASDQNIQQVQDALRDLVASGQSSMGAQLADAVKLKPDAIVIATAKYQLSDEDAAALQKAAKAGMTLYLFALGNTDLSTAMLSAASKNGGSSFHTISKSQLDQLAQ